MIISEKNKNPEKDHIIQALKCLSEKEAEEADNLLETCARTDGTLFSIEYSSESNLLRDEECLFLCRESKTERLTGLCYAFIPDENTAELTVVVHPDYRGRGLMTELLDASEESLEKSGIDTFFYIGHGTEEEKRIAEHMGLEISGEELLMELSEEYIGLYGNAPGSFENKEDEETKLCTAEAVVSGSTVCICNVYVPEKLRRKGLGRRVVENTVRKALLSNPELKHVILQVSGNNIPAVNLYKSMGFAVVGRTVYYTE